MISVSLPFVVVHLTVQFGDTFTECTTISCMHVHDESIHCNMQVEGIIGTYFANQKVPGRSFSSTLITHNKGGHWSRLTPPAVTRFGTPVICAPVCFHACMDINSHDSTPLCVVL